MRSRTALRSRDEHDAISFVRFTPRAQNIHVTRGGAMEISGRG